MRTRWRCVLLIGLAVAFVAGQVVVAGAEDPQPAAAIENVRYDFGEIFEQEAYKHSFAVKNNGNADLEIKSVKPG